MSNFTNRLIRALKLDVSVYREVEADKDATTQAMIVVVLASLAWGIALISTEGLGGLFTGTLSALISWFIWAYITFFIGTKVLPEAGTSADHGELLRTIGFAYSPGIIRIVGIIPFLQELAFVVANIWMLIAMVVAVKTALDYTSTLRAVGVCIIGWVIQGFITFLISSVLNIF